MPRPTPAATMDDVLTRAAIIDVINNYGAAMDRREWELYRSLFTDQVDIHFPDWTGSPRERIPAEQWVDIVVKGLGGFDATLHVITTHIVQINGDRATVDSHMTARHVYSPEEVEFLGGFYTHSLVRENGTWKLSGVKLNVTWDEGPRALFKRAFDRGVERLAQSR